MREGPDCAAVLAVCVDEDAPCSGCYLAGFFVREGSGSGSCLLSCELGISDICAGNLPGTLIV